MAKVLKKLKGSVTHSTNGQSSTIYTAPAGRVVLVKTLGVLVAGSFSDGVASAISGSAGLRYGPVIASAIQPQAAQTLSGTTTISFNLSYRDVASLTALDAQAIYPNRTTYILDAGETITTFLSVSSNGGGPTGSVTISYDFFIVEEF